jgi:hypothetical protein
MRCKVKSVRCPHRLRTLLGAATIVAITVVAGCTSMPVTSMVRLARTDFTTVDPAALRAALKLPDSIRPRVARLQLSVSVGNDKQTEEFTLADLADPGELASLRSEVTAGTSIYGYRLAVADIARFTSVRADMLARKASGAGGRMAIGVSADGCRTGPLPETIPLTTFLRTEAGGDFFALARGVDLRKALAGQDLAAKLPLCK